MKRMISAALCVLLAAGCAVLPGCGGKSAEAAPAGAATAATAATEESEITLGSIFERDIAALSYAGCAYAVQGGRVEFDNGASDKDYRVCSISKQFTAAAVLTLAEEGKLDVNESLERFFPDYKYASAITVHDLLCMRSGIEDYEPVLFDETFAAKVGISAEATAEENRQAVREWILAQELVFDPDSAYEYCDANYFLLAEIIEQLTGKAYEDFITERFLKPLKMDDTGFGDKWEGGYEGSDLGLTWTGYMGINRGCADLISNAVDLAKWGAEFIENKVLSDGVIKQMTTDYSPETDISYGYGISINAELGFIYHNGNISPMCGSLCVSKERGIVFVLLDVDDTGTLFSLRGVLCEDIALAL